MSFGYSGKLIVSSVAAAPVGNSVPRRLFILDRLSMYEFLIDTVSVISVIPPISSSTPSKYILFAANGSEIKTYGEKVMTLNVGLRRPITWTFVIAEVDTPIIGADILEYYHLLPDIREEVLIDAETSLKAPGISKRSSGLGISTIAPILQQHDSTSPYHTLLKNFQNITIPQNLVCLPPVRSTTRHHIITKGPPISARPRRLAEDKYKIAKAEYEHMVSLGICRPSSSPWANPLHMEKKPDGSWRPCGDYRKLNFVTVPNSYPIPHIHDFSANLCGAQIFSRIDLIRAFYQIPVAEEDVPKTAVITPFGLFEFLRMPFGLYNAPQTFQRFIDDVLRGLPFAYAYLDDVLIASSSEEEHLQHLQSVSE